MKIICTCAPSIGRFGIIAPVARSLIDKGHDVLFASPQAFKKEIIDAGFSVSLAGTTVDQARRAAEHRDATFSSLRADEQAEVLFTQILPYSLYGSLLPTLERWRPDAVLHEDGEFAAPMLARTLNIPSVNVWWPSPMRSLKILRELDISLAHLWRSVGLEPSTLGGMYSGLSLDTCPSRLQAAFVSRLGHRSLVRPEPFLRGGTEEVPASYKSHPNLRHVYVTFGTVPVFNSNAQLLATVLQALMGLTCQVLVTIGENNNIQLLQEVQLANSRIHISQFIPQEKILPYTDLMICHGGSGSTIGALMSGTPILFIPRGGAAQLRVARACTEAGAALMLDEDGLSVTSVTLAVQRLLNEASYVTKAQSIAREIEQMPSTTDAVGAIELFVERTKGLRGGRDAD